MPNTTNSSNIPQEWITTKTLKTISGASLCCWLITLFFDLICFMPINDLKLRGLLVLIISTVSALALAINKVFGSKSTNKRGLWILVLPNTMLIYIHALGFQVATKELALKANAAEVKRQEVSITTKADLASIFNFLTRQTSWIPSIEQTYLTAKFERDKREMRVDNAILTDSINTLNNRLQALSPHTEIEKHDLPVPQPVSTPDSGSFYKMQYKNCVTTNNMLKQQIAILQEDNEQLQISKSENANNEKRDSVLRSRIEEKNALINKWNTIMRGMRMPKEDIERVMNGHMGDEVYYRKLFTPIPTAVR